DRMPVGGAHAPVDEVPAPTDLQQGHEQRMCVRSRPRRRAGRDAVTARVRDGDDREFRLERLAVREQDTRGRTVHDNARRRRRAEERSVRPGRCRHREREAQEGRRRENSPPEAHVSGLPFPSSPTIESTNASPATTIATISSADEFPPPARESFASIRGDGVSDDSGPDQSTTSPLEYVCLRVKAYVFAPLALALKPKTESSSVGTLPPDQVTLVTVASSREPVDCTSRFQPGLGWKESMVKPLGGVSSIDVVVAPSFSVGTESVKNCSDFASTTLGLTTACADAAAGKASAATTAAATARWIRMRSSFRREAARAASIHQIRRPT